MKISDMKRGERYTISTTWVVNIVNEVGSSRYDYAEGRADSGELLKFRDEGGYISRCITRVPKLPKEPPQVGARVKRYFSDESGSIWERVESPGIIGPMRCWRQISSFDRYGSNPGKLVIIPHTWDQVVENTVKIVELVEHEVELW